MNGIINPPLFGVVIAGRPVMTNFT